MGSIKFAGPAGGPRCAFVLSALSCIRDHCVPTNSRVPDGCSRAKVGSNLTANGIAVCKPEGFVVVVLAWHFDGGDVTDEVGGVVLMRVDEVVMEDQAGCPLFLYMNGYSHNNIYWTLGAMRLTIDSQ
jgi:hypothetical protein